MSTNQDDEVPADSSSTVLGWVPSPGTPALAEAKLTPPNAPPNLVERARITRLLERSGEIVTVVAQAGFGKSTAVASWTASSRRRVAWLNLDPGDNDPVRFWRYVATAVDRAWPGVGEAALRDIERGQVDDAIVVLANELARRPRPLVLVLDDCHHLAAGEAAASLKSLLDARPQSLTVVLVGRETPPIPLARLRASGRVSALDARLLAFNLAEVEALLRVDGTEEDRDAAGAILATTEGWPAAVRLARLSLEGEGSIYQAARAFDGGNPLMADFIREEVLDQLSRPARDFLLRVAILGRVTAELANAALQTQDAHLELKRLESDGWFVVSLGGTGWYRVHPLLTQFVHGRPDLVGAEEAKAIHTRAAIWLGEQQLVIEALTNAKDAERPDLVAEILSRYHLMLLRTGDWRTLAQWAATLPDDVLRHHPEVACAVAVAITMRGAAAIERKRLTTIAARAVGDEPNRLRQSYVRVGVDMIRCAALDDGVQAAVRRGMRASALARAEVEEQLTSALAALAQSLYFAGDVESALTLAAEAATVPGAQSRPGGEAIARITLALGSLARGRKAEARLHAERAGELVAVAGATRGWLGALAEVVATLTAKEHGASAVSVERRLRVAVSRMLDERPSVHHAWATVHLAEAHLDLGRLDIASTTLEEACSEIDRIEDVGIVRDLADELRTKIADFRSRTPALSEDVVPTRAEALVLAALATELSTTQIARQLHRSAHTVRSQIRSLYRKLGVHNRADAVRRASALGLINTLGDGEVTS